VLLIAIISGCDNVRQKEHSDNHIMMSKEVLKDKIKGAWAVQTIGVTYGGPTEFKYLKRTIPDSVEINWSAPACMMTYIWI